MPIVVQWSREREDNRNDQREENVQEVEDQVPSVQEDEEGNDDYDHMLYSDDVVNMASPQSFDHSPCSVPTFNNNARKHPQHNKQTKHIR